MIEKFIHVHILKTAGTTIKENFFRPVYKEKCLIDMSFNQKRVTSMKFEDQSYPNDYENYDVIFGHFKGEKYTHWP